jgi:crotonobetainyl-CoA:carnitine CoA-transferase CaiB-like acyl-CoA transferase
MSPLAGALTGTRVLEVSAGLAAAYTGLMLSGLGADVARAERDRAPQPYDAFAGRGRLNLPDAVDGSALTALAARADVLLTDLPPAALRELGLPTSEAEVAALRPGLVHVAITSFGLDGPHAGFEADDIVDWAAGGLAFLTRRPSGRPAGTPPSPVLPPGRQPDMLAGIAAGIGVLAALREVTATGGSALVDVSRQEVQASMGHHAFPNFVWSSETLGSGGSSLDRIGMLVPSADGHVYLRAVEERQWLALAALMGLPDEVAAERIDGMLVHHRDPGQVRRWVEAWAVQHPTGWLVEQGQRARVPVADPGSLARVLASPHLAHRDAWRSVEVGGRSRRVPAVPLLEPEKRQASQPVTVDELLERWSA